MLLFLEVRWLRVVAKRNYCEISWSHSRISSESSVKGDNCIDATKMDGCGSFCHFKTAKWTENLITETPQFLLSWLWKIQSLFIRYAHNSTVQFCSYKIKDICGNVLTGLNGTRISPYPTFVFPSEKITVRYFFTWLHWFCGSWSLHSESFLLLYFWKK